MSVEHVFESQLQSFLKYLQDTNAGLCKPFCLHFFEAQQEPGTYLLRLFHASENRYYATYSLPIRPYNSLPASIFGTNGHYILHDCQFFLDDVSPQELQADIVQKLIRVMLYVGVVFKSCLNLPWVQHDCFQEKHDWSPYGDLIGEVLETSKVYPVQVCPNATMVQGPYDYSMRSAKACVQALLV